MTQDNVRVLNGICPRTCTARLLLQTSGLLCLSSAPVFNGSGRHCTTWGRGGNPIKMLFRRANSEICFRMPRPRLTGIDDGGIRLLYTAPRKNETFACLIY